MVGVTALVGPMQLLEIRMAMAMPLVARLLVRRPALTLVIIFRMANLFVRVHEEVDIACYKIGALIALELHVIPIAPDNLGVLLAPVQMLVGRLVIIVFRRVHILYLGMLMEVQFLLMVRVATLSPSVAAAIVLNAILPGVPPFALMLHLSEPGMLP